MEFKHFQEIKKVRDILQIVILFEKTRDREGLGQTDVLYYSLLINHYLCFVCN